jgi:ubiquinol-cytochrome c reductase cytochrome b subunit
MNDSEDRSLIRNIGLFAVLVVLINGLILPGSTSSTELLMTFYLAAFFHAGFTFYDGSFNTLRTLTWLLLIAAWTGSEFAGFSSYTFLWGQLKFWLSTCLTSLLTALPIAGERLAEAFWRNVQGISEVAALWPILILALLGLDVAVMHQADWRNSSLLRAGIFLAAAFAGALTLGLAAGALIGDPVPRALDMADIGGLPTPLKVVPDWYELPFYALLRAVPEKLAGVTIMFASLAVPAVWPWMGADGLRKGSTRRVWLFLCVSQAAIWAGLTYLGSRPPDPWVTRAAQVLGVFYFAFFLVWPPLLRRRNRAATGPAPI